MKLPTYFSVWLIYQMQMLTLIASPNLLTQVASFSIPTVPASRLPRNELSRKLSRFNRLSNEPKLAARSPSSSLDCIKQEIPNWLTYMRCIAIPLLVVVYYQPKQHILTAGIFAFASITDWLDGYLARRWKVTSDFGAFLDPVADKLMVSTALILLAGTWGPLVTIPTAIILAREIAVSALREWMAQRGKRSAVQVGFQGKVKTALTMTTLTLFLLVPKSSVDIDSLFWKSCIGLLYASTLITVTSGAVYFRAAAPLLFGKDE